MLWSKEEAIAEVLAAREALLVAEAEVRDAKLSEQHARIRFQGAVAGLGETRD